jgi:hypothetical protein
VSKIEHRITSNPCQECGGHPRNHRPNHKFQDGCCILPASAHREARKDTRRDRKRHNHYKKDVFWFIDGEGHNRHPETNEPTHNHRYVMLSAAGENGGEAPRIVNPYGLTSQACFDFVIDKVPRNAKIFSFGFGYDTTNWIRDCPNKVIYQLLRPSERKASFKSPKTGKIIHYNKAVYYSPDGKIITKNVYALNHMGSEISIRRGVWGPDEEKGGFLPKFTSHTARIHDIFKFFQRPFVEALKAWFIDPQGKLPKEIYDVLHAMQIMKDKRSSREWDALEGATMDYNDDECVLGAQLARKLQRASEDADYALKNRYDSSGTLAKIAMKKHGIIEEIRHASPEMRVAVAQASFGGRFENSVIGLVEGEIFGKDLSGAYNHSTATLPCLKCGVWERTTVREKLDGCKTALVRYHYSDPPKDMAWGPLPHRFKNQLICFPAVSGGGWVWLPEYLEAEKGWNHVHFVEAWVLRSECEHTPFAWVARLYNERLKLSKEGKGIVFKNVANSVPGSLMQTIGSGMFHCSIWAGLLTAETRSRLLQVITAHQDRWNLLSVATDGIVSRERLTLPPHFDTDFMLGEDAKNKTPEQLKKPLGGWEDKDSGPTFFIRPGQSLPWFADGITPEREQFTLKNLRSRGISRELMIKHGPLLIDTFIASLEGKKLDGTPIEKIKLEDGTWETGRGCYHLPEDVRFIPAKLAVQKKRRDQKNLLMRENSDHADPFEYVRSTTYGQWINRPRVINFDPRPKREFGYKVQEGTKQARLQLRHLPMDLECAPYDKYLAFDEGRDRPPEVSPEERKAQEAKDWINGQPDFDDFDFDALDLVEMEL